MLAGLVAHAEVARLVVGLKQGQPLRLRLLPPHRRPPTRRHSSPGEVADASRKRFADYAYSLMAHEATVLPCTGAQHTHQYEQLWPPTQKSGFFRFPCKVRAMPAIGSGSDHGGYMVLYSPLVRSGAL